MSPPATNAPAGIPARPLDGGEAVMLHDLNRVQVVAQRVIGAIPSLSDEALLQVRRYYQEIGGQAWAIVAKCDAEIRQRDKQAGGAAESRPDVARLGRMAGYQDRAHEAGVSVRTVRLNAALYETFKDELESELASACHSALDRQFYVEALAAPDPHAAITYARHALDGNPDFSAAQLRRDLHDQKRLATITALAARNPDPAVAPGRFSVIYADPPWQYEGQTTDPTRCVENHYPTLPLERICALPVGAWSHDDAVLFLWAPNPKLAEALQVMDAWGFAYRTSAVWVKDTMGMGYWFRQQHELLLVGRHGRMPAPIEQNRVSSVLHAPRQGHSAKPPEIYEIIERMYPGIPCLELFARTQRGGLWASWGNACWPPTPWRPASLATPTAPRWPPSSTSCAPTRTGR